MRFDRLDFLPHRQFIEQEISSIRQQGESRKKIEFMDD
jgi:hypothetical protein